MSDPSYQHPAHQPSNPLAPLRGQFPAWEAWRGIGGLLYARRRRSSPPVVFRELTGDGLARQIRKYEGGSGERHPGPRIDQLKPSPPQRR